ncbi:bacteriophage abortive infection AbiH family protein [Pseudoalteromonas sp. S16_S37]|uniref:bacteriophage abortive infection AbiH family protein n=1 Tax=Pseudoalteromonas sp. S16_S37 TaxID=2720228 RepID=UPI0016815F9D|nr:bacteriophage abortive infection AbiH family protein [Pseudoalteromonas sp. S16_S37]MBD1584927.1 hypothetical protein [Pseudoalteromonas sp. S16_S37]
MGASSVYIIGNGFDLGHDLPTSYSEFYKKEKAYLDEYGEFFGSIIGTCNWCDFENTLGEWDWELLFDSTVLPDVSDDNFKWSQVHGFEDAVTENSQEVVDTITERFTHWVESIDLSLTATRLNSLKCSSNFLSFNYTSVLQDVYGVEDNNILHIHGRARHTNALIFGHGESVEQTVNEDESGINSTTLFPEAEATAQKPLIKMKKPVTYILNKYSDWFEQTRGTELFVVIGHSLNEVDIPYFERLARINPQSKWLVSYHVESDKDIYRNKLIDLGISADNLTACTFGEIDDCISNYTKQNVLI